MASVIIKDLKINVTVLYKKLSWIFFLTIITTFQRRYLIGSWNASPAPSKGLLKNTDSLGLCLLKINILGKRLIVISYTKLWFEASSLNSCIATKGYKSPPLLNFKKCYIESAYSRHKTVLNLLPSKSECSQLFWVHSTCKFMFVWENKAHFGKQISYTNSAFKGRNIKVFLTFLYSPQEIFLSLMDYLQDLFCIL